jgi:hypothetical protein
MDFLSVRINALGNAPRQEGFAWAKEKQFWQTAFPQYAHHLAAVPSLIDRAYLWRVCSDLSLPIDVRFLIIMVWGYGTVGYGPYRTQKMFSSEGLNNSLETTRRFLLDGKPLEAYRTLQFSGIHQLGPAYSTKVMCFLAGDAEIAPPIFDSVVSKTLAIHYPDVFNAQNSNSQIWSISNYSGYLRFVEQKSETLQLTCHEIELLLYV